MDPRARRVLDELAGLSLSARLQVVAAVLDALDEPVGPSAAGSGRPTPAVNGPRRGTGEVDGQSYRPAGAGQSGERR
jgi:hypothetical protein